MTALFCKGRKIHADFCKCTLHNATATKYRAGHSRGFFCKHRVRGIKEGWKQKASQRSSRRFGGKICSIPCRARCFGSVDLKETVEFNRFFQIDWLNSIVSYK